MSDISVVPFPATVVDMVTSLRKMADRIEAGTEEPKPRFVMVVTVGEHDEMSIYGFGKVGLYEACGALGWASTHMGNGGIRGDDAET